MKNEARIVDSREETKTLRIKGLKPSRLQDPLLSGPVKVTPVPILV